MALRKYFFLGIVICFFSNYSFAQIYAQGKNINNEKIFSVAVELEPKPLDPGNYHAFIEFYGQRKEVKWYLKDGVEHKAFGSKEELVKYMEDNGWIYLNTRTTSKRISQNVHEKLVFRKSMQRLSSEYSDQANIKNQP
jgi:hypothetical protein